MSFLSELSASLIDQQITDYKDLAIILPNQRAKKTLYREWAARITTPVLAPAVLTIDELMRQLSPIQLVTNFELLVELFQISETMPALRCDDFQKFVSWGSNFLKDLNEIDMYLVDGEKIFDTQLAFKETTFVMQDKLSQNQQRYLALYEALKPLYLSFTEHLKKINKGYMGLIYRNAAEHITTYAGNCQWKRMVFAGLHALSPSESIVTQYFNKNIPCKFIFDLDPFYYDTDTSFKIKEAISKITNTLQIKEIKNVQANYTNIQKDIRILGVSKKMAQIYQAIELLKPCSEDELRETAVVFADESLLMPFVHTYAHSGCNITMGYPIKYTRTYQLFEAFMNAAQNLRRLQNVSNGAFYHKDVLTLLRNSLIKEAFFDNEYTHTLFVERIVKSNRIFFSDNVFAPIGDIFPKLHKDGVELVTSLRQFFQHIAEKLINNSERNISQLFAEILSEVAETMQQFPADLFIDIRTVGMFVEERIQQLSIPFQRNEGAPLQVMGLLETRALDFKHVIILSVNEGVLPIVKSENTLLLYEVKQNFGLPTMQQNEAIYAYHFFRLLQRAEKVELIYNADSTGSNGVAEESRFIRQLEWRIEQMKLPYKISRDNALYISPQNGTSDTSIEIANNEAIRQQLSQISYSASSLSSYIRCPLQFYFKHIAHLEPRETIEESIEQRIIGNVIHQILEHLFNELKQRHETVDEATFMQQIEKVITKHISEENITKTFEEQKDIGERDLQRGKIFLARQVVKKTLDAYGKIIIDDFSQHNISIIGTELPLNTHIKVEGKCIALTGFADRIDLRNNRITILDYKTGALKKLSFDTMENVFKNPDMQQLLQLLMYGYLYRKNEKWPDDKPELYPQTDHIDCAIVSFQKLMKGNTAGNQDALCPPTYANKKNSEFDMVGLLDDFEKKLKELLTRMLTADTFPQTQDAELCKYCDYAEICARNC